jgi:hypothetical protein
VDRKSGRIPVDHPKLETRKMRPHIAVLTFLSIALCSPGAYADDEEEEFEDDPVYTDKRFALRAGVYDITASTRLRLDSSNGEFGTQIDLESDLNLEDNKSSSYFEVTWRFKERHALEFETFGLDRAGLETLTGEIKFGDEVYEVGAVVNSYFNTDVTRISYAYIFNSSDTFSFAASAGIHVTSIRTGISEISPAIQSVENVEVADVTAPLPVIGISAGWGITDRLSVFGRAQMFRLEFDDYRGQLDHATLKMEYEFSEHFGAGIGYDLFDITVSADKPHFDGSVRFRFHGPILFLTGTF